MSISKKPPGWRHLAGSAALWLPLAALGTARADEPALVRAVVPTQETSGPGSLAAGDALGLELLSRQARARGKERTSHASEEPIRLSDVPASPAPEPQSPLRR